MNNLTPRQIAERNYKNSRFNLMLMMVFTLLNIILLITGSETMMLFSATVPYLFMAVGIFAQESAVLVVCGIIVANCMIAYLLCWLLSKKYRGWMTVALVLFALDTAVMVALLISAGDSSGILDIVIHAWVLYYLIVGVINSRKLRKMPPDELEAEVAEAPQEERREYKGPEL